jgi:hypothetical protein
MCILLRDDRHPGAPGEVDQLGQQLVQLHRLGQEVVHLDVVGRRGILADGGRHHDHRDARRGRILHFRLTELPAVHYRHQQVQQDDVGKRGDRQGGQGLLAVGGTGGPVPRLCQGVDQAAPHVEIVVDDQHVRPGLGHGGTGKVGLVLRCHKP